MRRHLPAATLRNSASWCELDYAFETQSVDERIYGSTAKPGRQRGLPHKRRPTLKFTLARKDQNNSEVFGLLLMTVYVNHV